MPIAKLERWLDDQRKHLNQGGTTTEGDVETDDR